MLLDSSSYHATASRRGTEDWRFRFARGKRLSIPLTKHTLDVISQPGVTVRSFTLTRNRLSLCIALDVAKLECTSTVGVDRNLRNLTVGNEEETRHYDLSKTVRIASTTMRIVASFKRDDARIRSVIRRSMDSEDLLGLVICSMPPRRRSWMQRSSGDRHSFWKIFRAYVLSTGRVTVRVESIGVG